MARDAELARSVDGRPSPTMTAWGDGASTAALVLRQVLSLSGPVAGNTVELGRYDEIILVQPFDLLRAQ
jgi:hypothetical protein